MLIFTFDNKKTRGSYSKRYDPFKQVLADMVMWALIDVSKNSQLLNEQDNQL